MMSMEITKKRKKWEVIEIEDEESDEFLFELEKVEANALSSVLNSQKRTKIITESHAQPNRVLLGFGCGKAKQEEEEEEEGAYMAALRGSKSTVWQQRLKPIITASSNSHSSSNSAFAASGVSSPEKMCPCGLGACLVLIASTQKNRGRTFYRCPSKPENGGCNFFQWCDSDNTASSGGASTVTQPYYVSSKSINNANGCVWPELLCPCGAGSCSILTAKTGKNVGHQFYRCPANQGSCGFFKWCNDSLIAAGPTVYASGVHSSMNDSSGRRHASGSTCFKCGKEGHWARDCQSSSANSALAEFGGRPAPSGACYKCGKPGHWAKDCSSVNT